MQMTCPHCRAGWEYAERRPAFCPFCGRPVPEETTVAAPPPDALVTTPFRPEDVTEPHAGRQAGGDADPEVIGGYRLLRVLGAGGMGKVYEAEDAQSGRRVALKLVAADYAGSAGAAERFRQEGRLASLIAHPRCVFVLAADEEAGRPYIVMELMPGDTLEDYVRLNGPQPPGEAVALILDVIEGLREAHRVGVIHRDVKPSNCFFGKDGRLKVGDFGLSKSLGQGAHLTKTGSFLGTPLYASPEQVRGEAVDAQTDVYSTAATLYFLLTGRAPFQNDNAAVTLARIASDPPPSLRTLRPDLPPALDEVVLRGLERDRKRRWRDLDEFAEALRPFLPGRLSLAGLGVRFGALAIDYGVFFLVSWPLTLLLINEGLIDPFKSQTVGEVNLPAQLAGVLLGLLYWGVPEGVWGWSVGKWLLGLRVRQAASGKVPGVGRGLLRYLSFSLLLNLGTLVTALILVPLFRLPAQPTPEEAIANLPNYMLLSFAPLAGLVTGVVLLLCPMRARNGYRGLHEFLSGTRVVPLPGRPRHTLRVAAARTTLSQLPGVPEVVGPFDVRGSFRWDDRAKVLLGVDVALGRPVLLWLRPAGEPPLDAKRREVNRTTRLRWLAAGHAEEYQWDAFVAPGGCPLLALLQANGRLSWPQAQPLLEQLTDELVQAVEEGTAPGSLEPGMVWVGTDERAILLDVPVTGPAGAGGGPDDVDNPEGEAVGLLARVAVLSLEGPSELQEVPRAVRAPLPLPAAAALRDLLVFRRSGLSLRDWRRRLLRLHEKPREVTRARRAGQLAVMSLLLFCAFGCCLSPATGFSRFAMELGIAASRTDADEAAIADLDLASLSDCLCASSDPNVLARARLVPVLDEDRQTRRRLEDDVERTRRKADERVQRGGTYYKLMAVQFQEQRAKQRAAYQLRAGRLPRQQTVATLRQSAASRVESWPAEENAEQVFWMMNLIPFLVAPGLWIVWAFLSRGGLSYWLLRIAPVGSDGRLAGRFRCAWRAALVWVPVVGLLLLSYWLEQWYWSQWGTPDAPLWAMPLSWAVWWAACGLLAGYVVLALRYPTRAPHDRAAGIYLVPR